MAFVATNDLSQIQAVKLDESIITLRGVSKQFRDEYAVRDVTFEVPKGSIFGFIGPSGSGKTTTVRLITGIYLPSEGEVKVMGRNPLEFSQTMRENIGYMPQLFVLYPNLTVWENLNFAASIYGMGFFRGKRLRKVLDFVELTEHRDKITRDTSGGMQRRLSLAATLVHDPDLIFLDEPTAGIDPVLRRKFWDHFKELQKQGNTLFITTQYVNEATFCDWVGVMANGKLLVVDTPDGLRHRAFGGEVVNLQTSAPLDYRAEQELYDLQFVRGQITRTGPASYHIVVDEASTAMPALMEWTKEKDITIEAIEEFLPPFDDVFVELIKDETNAP